MTLPAILGSCFGDYNNYPKQHNKLQCTKFALIYYYTLSRRVLGIQWHKCSPKPDIDKCINGQ